MSKYLENKKLNVLDIGYTLKPALKPEKLREKVAEITINPKTAQKYEDYGIMVGFNYFTKKSPHISVQAPFEI